LILQHFLNVDFEKKRDDILKFNRQNIVTKLKNRGVKYEASTN
jgi:hypothetical protein